MELKMFNAIAQVMAAQSSLPVDECERRLGFVERCAVSRGVTFCDLKPLAELLGCEPEMGEIERKAHQGVVLIEALRKKLDDIRERVGCDKGEYLLGRIDDLVNLPAPALASWYCAQVAQALNWRRTEFDTLDELLDELRASEAAHSKFVDSAIEQNALMETVRELLCLLAETLGSTPLLDEAIELLEPRSSRDDLVELDSSKLEAMLRKPSGFAEGGYVKELPEYDVAAVLYPIRTLLHAGDLYRDVTILLRTEQLVAWRTADGQEHSARAHQVMLDPDEDGLAAAILSRIAGVEIAPEHMAELRAQMAGGVTHG